jgi:hypothetical protein
MVNIRGFWAAVLAFGFLGLIQAQVTTARIQSIQPSSTDSIDMSMPRNGDDGGTNNYFTSNHAQPDYGTNLWLEITNVSNGQAYLNLHNATDMVYEVWSRTDLLEHEAMGEGRFCQYRLQTPLLAGLQRPVWRVSLAMQSIQLFESWQL